MNLKQLLNTSLSNHLNVINNPDRKRLINNSLSSREAVVSESGALATWTPVHSTGRSPKNTFIVRQSPSEDKIDWTSANNIPISKEIFDYLYNEAIKVLSKKKIIYQSNRVIGADPKYAFPVNLVTDRALVTLFGYNMFREVPHNFQQSIFKDDEFNLLVLPYNYLDPQSLQQKFKDDLPSISKLIIAMDMDRKLGLVMGSSYLGSIKKLMFTVVNFILPDFGVMPLHCSANQNHKGECSLFLGLSGTGKTTLSTDHERELIGDDEHAWTDTGIANYEYGCYAKLINLNPEKEPGIYKAVFTKRKHLDHGCIVENAMMYPDGTFDLDDDRLTQNSRVSYPLEYLDNVKNDSLGRHPKTIIFLTADAFGVLPPVAKLDPDLALLWFLMGYTSKLAGTETGIITPKSTFSRFFGEPFMPRHPQDYLILLKEKLTKYHPKVYLINTGWSGGPFGIGMRMDIDLTRRIVNQVLGGNLDEVVFRKDERFHFLVPSSCPGVDSKFLSPKSTWKDVFLYEETADKLSSDFRSHFHQAYSKSGIDVRIQNQLPV
ncbi:phosphoenolpyruvate carboxykinase (ATP) [Candidatus Gottesmanbacteria bacterium]|nr:phosphoenolpyruvate carboxykinase (ATP) [Candidatus Gottesmanbacteria bacterium]